MEHICALCDALSPFKCMSKLKRIREEVEMSLKYRKFIHTQDSLINNKCSVCMHMYVSARAPDSIMRISDCEREIKM